MNSYSCKLLNTSLSFFSDRVNLCCSGVPGPGYEMKDGIFDIDNFIEFKNKCVENFKNGIVSDNCRNCYEIRPYDESAVFDKLHKIIFNHFTHCNCACIYCARKASYNTDFTDVVSKSKYYDVLPIIEKLYQKDLISETDLTLDFQGGDIGVLKEFRGLLNLFSKHNVARYQFTTNNIVYFDEIEELMKRGLAKIITSVDAGTKETYKKIKRVDKFDTCIANMKKYIENTGSKNIVTSKFILLEGINDNADEISKFISIMSDIGVDTLVLDMDYRFIMSNNENKRYVVPKHFYDLYSLFEEKCKENNIFMYNYPYTKTILDKGYFE